MPRITELHNAPGTAEYYIALGNIVLAAVGKEACQGGYGTTDPEWVGRYAIEYGDIQPDGTLN